MKFPKSTIIFRSYIDFVEYLFSDLKYNDMKLIVTIENRIYYSNGDINCILENKTDNVSVSFSMVVKNDDTTFIYEKEYIFIKINKEISSFIKNSLINCEFNNDDKYIAVFIYKCFMSTHLQRNNTIVNIDRQTLKFTSPVLRDKKDKDSYTIYVVIKRDISNRLCRKKLIIYDNKNLPDISTLDQFNELKQYLYKINKCIEYFNNNKCKEVEIFRNIYYNPSMYVISQHSYVYSFIQCYNYYVILQSILMYLKKVQCKDIDTIYNEMNNELLLFFIVKYIQ